MLARLRKALSSVEAKMNNSDSKGNKYLYIRYNYYLHWFYILIF